MPHAVIWGAGVAGLTAAVALADRGWSVEIRERAAAVNTDGAALGIWPEIQIELDLVGIWTDIAPHAVPYRRAQVRDLSGRRLADLPLHRIERRWSRPVVLVRRPALMAALRDRVLAHEAITLEFDRGYEGGSAAGVDLEIAADGVHSRLREQVAQETSPAVMLGATAWRGASPLLTDTHGEVWGRRAFAGLTPCSATTTNWYVALDDALEVSSRNGLLSMLEGWPAPVRQVVERTPDSDLLTHRLLEAPRLDRHHRGNTVLIGDAAHAMAPSLGMGACQAIVDALTLARILHLHGGEVTPALRQYDATRRPETNRLVARSRRLLRLQLGAAGGIRNGLLRFVGRLDRPPRGLAGP